MLIETDLRLTMNHVSNGLRLTSYLMNTSWSGGVHQSKEQVSQGPSLFAKHLATQTSSHSQGKVGSQKFQTQ